MWLHKQTAVGEVLWGDKDGGTAKLTVRFPFSLSLAAASTSLQAVANAAQAISDATIIKLTLRWQYYESDPPTASVESNVARYLCLYYSNGVDTEPVFIPSGDESLLEASGRFAGIRLDLADSSVVSLADALTAALMGTLDPSGAGWDRVLVVGGITR